MPSVSRNQATVSVTLGDESTPWPMRWIDVGDLPSRITRPTRRPGSRAVLCSSRATLIGSTRFCPDTTSIWYPLGSVRRTRLPPPGSSSVSIPEAPGSLARRSRSSSSAACRRSR